MADNEQGQVKLLPAPWDEPFARFDEFLAETHELLRLVEIGTKQVSRFPRVFKPAILRQVERGVERAEVASTRIEEVEERAKQAKKLIQTEFSILRGHMLVGLWGALEALIFNLVVNHLVNRPATLNSEKISKVRVPVAVLEEPNKQARMTHVAEEMTQQLRIGFLSGASRFETFLELVDLSGPLSDELRKALFETAQVRNLIVHRTASVDRRFQLSCPWLNVQVGTRFDVTEARFGMYAKAIADYATLLYERVRRVSSSTPA